MPKGIKGYQKGHVPSKETRLKISLANRHPVYFNCEYCGCECVTKRSVYKKYKRHFCSIKCYAGFRQDYLPPEEQNAFKNGGIPQEEKQRRIKARSDLNHAIRDGKVKRLPCERCGHSKSQGHHSDYDKPLDVQWLCRDCHWQEHTATPHPSLLEAER